MARKKEIVTAMIVNLLKRNIRPDLIIMAKEYNVPYKRDID